MYRVRVYMYEYLLQACTARDFSFFVFLNPHKSPLEPCTGTISHRYAEGKSVGASSSFGLGITNYKSTLAITLRGVTITWLKRFDVMESILGLGK